ncbi:MAG: SPFH/Band 7/PHB domain protein [candidate division KSB1 bacterium]|nr:SPFH/Band 7/PHB domain protein [candidate division KSB1 bacterium]
MDSIFYYILGIVGVLILLGYFIFKGVVIVRQAEAMVIERLGKFHRLLYSGLNWIFPFIDKPRVLDWRYVEYDADGKPIFQQKKITAIDLKETFLDFPRQNVITADNIFIEINALLSYQIVDPKSVAYKINNLPFALEKETQTCLRSLIGEMTLDQILSSRETIRQKIRAMLESSTESWGIKINNVALQEINPPPDIRDEMEKVMRAERDRRATVTAAEGQKTAAILESQGELEATINAAEAEKRSLILKAEGEAYARLRLAQAEADAIRRIADALESKGIEPTQYMIAMRYLETLKEMVSGKDNKVVYLPIEAVGVLGSLGAIKDLFKDLKPIETNFIRTGGDNERGNQSDQGLA